MGIYIYMCIYKTETMQYTVPVILQEAISVRRL